VHPLKQARRQACALAWLGTEDHPRPAVFATRACPSPACAGSAWTGSASGAGGAGGWAGGMLVGTGADDSDDSTVWASAAPPTQPSMGRSRGAVGGRSACIARINA
jgi:hypothetical protein